MTTSILRGLVLVLLVIVTFGPAWAQPGSGPEIEAREDELPPDPDEPRPPIDTTLGGREDPTQCFLTAEPEESGAQGVSQELNDTYDCMEAPYQAVNPLGHSIYEVTRIFDWYPVGEGDPAWAMLMPVGFRVRDVADPNNADVCFREASSDINNMAVRTRAGRVGKIRMLSEEPGSGAHTLWISLNGVQLSIPTNQGSLTLLNDAIVAAVDQNHDVSVYGDLIVVLGTDAGADIQEVRLRTDNPALVTFEVAIEATTGFFPTSIDETRCGG